MAPPIHPQRICMATRNGYLTLAQEVKKHQESAGRHELPWRVHQTPYRVFVSEIMLQQTQVDRVAPKFKSFIKKFPTFKALARASLLEVYALWKGLGYNRRAKYLRDAARIVMTMYGGILPNNKEELQKLPGVGPYSAGAILSFAYGNSEPFVETNIRTAVMYHVHGKRKSVTDEEVVEVLVALQPRSGTASKNWYAALMDYGAYLKVSGVQLNKKSAHYSKQSKFRGSLRQVRGAVLRHMAEGRASEKQLLQALSYKRSDIKKALLGLSSEGLIVCKNQRWRLSA